MIDRPAPASRRRTVISLQGIRPVAPPEQQQQQYPSVISEGLAVGALISQFLPFELDEQDPLLGDGAQNPSRDANDERHETGHTTTEPHADNAGISMDTAPIENFKSDSSGESSSDNEKEGEQTQVARQGDIVDSPDDEYVMRRRSSDKENEGEQTHVARQDDIVDSSDDEYVMRQSITAGAAQTDELESRSEAEITAQMDSEILKSEEIELMNSLEANIQSKEALDRAPNDPPVPIAVANIGEDYENPWEHFSGFKRPPKFRRLLHEPAVTELTQCSIYTAKRKVPKYSSGGVLLFTRGELQTCVIDQTERQLREKDTFMHWNVSVVDKKYSYVIQYHGPEAGLYLLANRCQDWIRYRVNHHNLKSLLQDGENLKVDVDISNMERIGGVFEKNSDYLNLSLKQQMPDQEGVWFYARNPEEGLPKLLGMKAFEAGCAVTAVNWEPVLSQSGLIAQIELVAEKRGTMKISLCLSKYADLKKVDLLNHRLRRVDGQKFVSEYYDDLRVEWLLRRPMPTSAQNVVISYQEYPATSVLVPSTLPHATPHTKVEQVKRINMILSDDLSVEVDVTMLAEIPLGFDVVHNETFLKEGMFCKNVRPGGQLSKVFGDNALKLGAVVFKANGVKIQTATHLKEIQDKANLCDGTFRVTFIFHDGTDLSQVDRSKLVRGRTNPRRRNGLQYPLHLHPKPKPSKPRNATTKKRAHPGNSREKLSEENKGPPQKKKSSKVTERDTKKDESTSPTLKTIPKIAQVNSYKNFKAKYKDTVDIEYGNTGINLHTVFSSMWAQHKALMGAYAFCDDNCMCVGKLTKLSKNVIYDFVEEQNNKGQPVDDGSIQSVGFVTNFAKRFLKRLYKEYPGETPTVLLSRLVDMWPFHQKQWIYGVRCKDNCDCKEAWDLLFGKGDKKTALEASKGLNRGVTAGAVQKKRAQHALKASEGTRGEVTAGTIPKNGAQNALANFQSLPRKKKAPMSTSSTLLLNKTIPAQGDSRVVADNSFSARRPSQLQTYHIDFATSVPLGAFFTNDGDEFKCKIHSVDPTGQARTRDRQKRVQAGTVVYSVVVDCDTVRIQNYDDLRQQYNLFRSKKKEIRIAFINSEVWFAKPQSGKLEWSCSGNWQGSPITGWAGGAANVKELENASKQRATKSAPSISSATETADAPLYPLMEPVDMLTDARTAYFAADGVTGEWRLAHSAVDTRHRTLAAGKSILRAGIGVEPGQPKSVKFLSERNESREYDVLSMASERLIRASQLDTVEMKENHLSPLERLTGAVENQTCHDLIAVLDSGAASDHRVTDTDMQYLNASAKRLAERVEIKLSENPSDSVLDQQLKDLLAKRQVLKLYIASSHWISMAMSLESWTRLEIKVHHIEIQKRSNDYVQGRSDILRGRAITIFNSRTPDHLGDLPKRTLHGYILYDESEGLPTFFSSNNLHFTKEIRHFVLELLEGDLEDSATPLKLGDCVFSLNEIDKQCPRNGEPIIYQRKIQPNDQLKSGDVKFEIRRCQVDPEWVYHKKTEAENGLKEQIDIIRKFNEEHPIETFGKLSGHITGPGNVTLTHALINLQQEELVKKLVALGVRPSERSDMGTAIGHAVKLKEYVYEKLENMKKTEHKRDEHKIQKLQHLHDTYQRIVNLLRSAKGSLLFPTVTSLSEPAQAPALADPSTPTMPAAPEAMVPWELYNDLPVGISSHQQKPPPAPEEMTDIRILSDIIKHTKPIDGYEPGTAARKSLIGCRLKENYPDHFARKEDTHNFLERVVSQGLAVEYGTAGNIVLKLVAPLDIKVESSTTSTGRISTASRPPSEPLPNDETLFREILKTCPKVDGYPPGTAAHKCVVGSRLKERYGGHFPKDSTKKSDFFERLLAAGIAEEFDCKNSNRVLKLVKGRPVSKGYTMKQQTTNTNNIPQQYHGNPNHMMALPKKFPVDEVLLKEILASAPPPPGSRQGTAVLRSVVGNWIREHYPVHYSKATMKAFCERLMTKGLVVQTESAHGSVFRVF